MAREGSRELPRAGVSGKLSHQAGFSLEGRRKPRAGVLYTRAQCSKGVLRGLPVRAGERPGQRPGGENEQTARGERGQSILEGSHMLCSQIYLAFHLHQWAIFI